MFALIAFFIGLFIFFKGGFRISNRTVTKAQSRSISIYLMAPLIVLFCASMIIVMNTPNLIQWGADGTSFTVNQDQAVMDYIGNTTGIIELIVVGIAIVLVMYTIYGSAQGNVPAPTTQRSQASSSAPPLTPTNPMPNILTVAEAAAYMRITEKEVLGLIDQGKLGAARIGDSYRIARIAIENFMTGG